MASADNATVISNTIANNSIGVSIFSALNDVFQNNLICNSLKAIDLNGVGNNSQPTPIILTASPSEITGTALFNNNFSDVEIYLQDNSTCPNAACQGSYVGVVAVQSDGTWTFNPPANFNPGDVVTAMSSISLGGGIESSELSACATVIDLCNPDNDPPMFANIPPDITIDCLDLAPATNITASDFCDGDCCSGDRH